MIRIGDIEIEIINDARILADAGGAFGLVPRPLWSPFIAPDDQNRIPMDHNCLLVRAGGKTILVETGYGLKLSDKQIARLSLTRLEGGLVAGLAKRGVKPEQVDLVINTHLHADHCSGNTVTEGDAIKPVFPNAEYRVQRLEYADAAFPNERTRATYFRENFAPLYESGQMRLLDGEVEIVPGIRCVVTPGHTRGHQSVVFEAGGRAAICVADLASLSVHFANLAWMTAYDVEPLVTLETKRIWQRWALAHDALLLFVHDPLIPVGRLIRDGEKLRVVAAEG
jgi:glyoxylase-like metal-dependent hydrolase (beta-lactamase superfamily II)